MTGLRFLRAAGAHTAGGALPPAGCTQLTMSSTVNPGNTVEGLPRLFVTGGAVVLAIAAVFRLMRRSGSSAPVQARPAEASAGSAPPPGAG